MIYVNHIIRQFKNNTWVTDQHLPWGTRTTQALLLVIAVWLSSKWVAHVTCTKYFKSLVTIVALHSHLTMPFAVLVHSVAIGWFTTRAGVAGSAVHDKRELGFEEAVQESERKASVDSDKYTSSQSWWYWPLSRIASLKGFAERQNYDM